MLPSVLGKKGQNITYVTLSLQSLDYKLLFGCTRHFSCSVTDKYIAYILMSFCTVSVTDFTFNHRGFSKMAKSNWQGAKFRVFLLVYFAW